MNISVQLLKDLVSFNDQTRLRAQQQAEAIIAKCESAYGLVVGPALASGFLLTESGGGKQRITIDFETLEGMHAAHQELISAVTKSSAPPLDENQVLAACSKAFGQVQDYDLRGNPITDYNILMTGAYGPAIRRLIQYVRDNPADPTPVALEGLEKAVEACSQECGSLPWGYEPHGDTGTYGVAVLLDENDVPQTGRQESGEMLVSQPVAGDVHSQAMAEFIAAANPVAVGNLIKEIRRLRAAPSTQDLMYADFYRWLRQNNIIANVRINMSEVDRPYMYAEALDEVISNFIDHNVGYPVPERLYSLNEVSNAS